MGYFKTKKTCSIFVTKYSGFCFIFQRISGFFIQIFSNFFKMRLKTNIPVTEIAKIIQAKAIGHTDLMVNGINEIHKVETGNLTFVDVEKYFSKSLNSAASVIILNKEVPCPEGKCLLLHPEPFEAYNFLTKKYRPVKAWTETISGTAKIHPSTIIEPNVVIGHDVTIGENCLIHPNVTIYNNVSIGNNVIIHSGSVIGGDAFYYKTKPEGFEKWHSCGEVIIEDDVEIGACCTIDKGVSGKTRIGKGTKIDNQVHLGHGVEIGERCVIAAQVGIAGKTIVEDGVTIYGQAGLSKSLRIGKSATILAQSGISKSLEGGKTYFGYPAGEIRTVYRELAALRQLPDVLKKLKNILK